MAETVVWVVPGFGGSELWQTWRDAAGRKTAERRCWLDVHGVVNGELYELLRFGVTPPDSTVELGDPLYLGYGSLRNFMGGSDKPAGWTVRFFPFDWRNGVRESGTLLANAIEAYGPVPGGHRLVGHSQGGMVCVAARRVLLDRGKADMVPRIVTIGGPVFGTYSTARTWCEYEDTMNLLSAVATIGDYLSMRRGRTVDERLRTLLSVFSTFPGVYDMLPDPAGGDDPGDTHRAMVWDPDSWAGCLVPPDRTLLLNSKTGFQRWFHDPLTTPPASVIVHFVGEGEVTPNRISPSPYLDPAAFQRVFRDVNPASPHLVRQALLPQFSSTRDGDNRCTLAQQAYPGRMTIRVAGAHAELQSHPVVWHLLYTVLQQEITYPPPVTADYPEPQWPESGVKGAVRPVAKLTRD